MFGFLNPFNFIRHSIEIPAVATLPVEESLPTDDAAFTEPPLSPKEALPARASVTVPAGESAPTPKPSAAAAAKPTRRRTTGSRKKSPARKNSLSPRVRKTREATRPSRSPKTAKTPLSDQIAFSVRLSGAHVMPFISSKELMRRERELISELRVSMDLRSEIWEGPAKALIERLARLVGSLPASEGMHDCDPGGLFRHSIMVALNAVAQLKFSPEEKCPHDDKHRLGVLFAALSHDVLKVVTDFRVSSADDEAWDPFLEDLEDFMEGRDDPRVIVDFNRGRGKDHTLCPALAEDLLLRGDLRVWSLVGDPALCQRIIEHSHQIWDLVRQADTFCTGRASARGAARVNVQDFMRAKLMAMVGAGIFDSNMPGAEIFTCERGVILVQEGEGYFWFRRRYKELLGWETVGHEHDVGNFLRRSGMAEMVGSQRLFQWYRIECGDKVVYLKGLLLRTPLSEDIKHPNLVERGVNPPEIAALLEAVEGREGRALRYFVLDLKDAPPGVNVDPDKAQIKDVRFLDPQLLRRVNQKDKRDLIRHEIACSRVKVIYPDDPGEGNADLEAEDASGSGLGNPQASVKSFDVPLSAASGSGTVPDSDHRLSTEPVAEAGIAPSGATGSAAAGITAGQGVEPTHKATGKTPTSKAAKTTTSPHRRGESESAESASKATPSLKSSKPEKNVKAAKPAKPRATTKSRSRAASTGTGTGTKAAAVKIGAKATAAKTGATATKSPQRVKVKPKPPRDPESSAEVAPGGNAAGGITSGAIVAGAAAGEASGTGGEQPPKNYLKMPLKNPLKNSPSGPSTTPSVIAVAKSPGTAPALKDAACASGKAEEVPYDRGAAAPGDKDLRYVNLRTVTKERSR